MIEDDNYDEDTRCPACYDTECCGAGLVQKESWWLVVKNGFAVGVRHSQESAELLADVYAGASIIEVKRCG